MQGLKDIKDIVEVTDYSLYYLLGLVGFICLAITVLLYKYFTRVKKTKVLSKKQIAFKNLKNIDYTDTKQSIYTFSREAALFVDENNKDEFGLIEKELEQYKYKKVVGVLADDVEAKLKKFIADIKA